MVAEADVVSQFFYFLIDDPTPEEVLNYTISEVDQYRWEELLRKNQEDNITTDERAEMEYFIKAEHLVRIAKIRALQKIKQGREVE